jgi:hypothetical protein
VHYFDYFALFEIIYVDKTQKCAQGLIINRETTEMTPTLKIKLQIAAADAMNCAEQVSNGTGWRQAPAQSTVCMKLIESEPHKVVMDIMKIWNSVFQQTHMKLASQGLAAA